MPDLPFRHAGYSIFAVSHAVVSMEKRTENGYF